MRIRKRTVLFRKVRLNESYSGDAGAVVLRRSREAMHQAVSALQTNGPGLSLSGVAPAVIY